MEVVLKTKKSSSEPLGQLIIYDFAQDEDETFQLHVKSSVVYDSQGCPDNQYVVEIINVVDGNAIESTLKATICNCSTNEAYLNWLNKHIEFILVNGTFFFECEDETQTNEEVPF